MLACVHGGNRGRRACASLNELSCGKAESVESKLSKLKLSSLKLSKLQT